MTETEFAERFSDALVSEIKAEMGRQSLSSRALGRLIGKSSQYMSDRLDGGNVKTGRRVILNVWDISSIAKALGLSEVELVARAESVALGHVVRAPFGREANVVTPADTIDYVETPDLENLDYAASRGTRKADEEPWAE
ncbi:MAG: hypothetical protein LBE05_05940 [Microbacterium sp.]|jgi:hypothetical protein|nr:hypothetical protein [Microbacterium sp.]